MGGRMNQHIHQSISQKAKEMENDIIHMRRHFHMYPELPGEEKETSSFVAEKLHALGMEVQTSVGGYGVVGILNGAKPGTTFAWRADMDAYATQEKTDLPYKSKRYGVMHVCGHDAHTAIGIGIAQTLSSFKDDLSGRIKFVFQPFEEGSKGAQRMIDDGVLENPRPSAIYGLHQGSLGANQRYLEAGELGLIYRTALYGWDRINIDIKVKREKFNSWAEQEMFLNRISRINRCTNPYGTKDSDDLVDLQILKKEGNDDTGEIHIKARFRYAMQQYRDVIRQALAKIIDDYATQPDVEVKVDYEGSLPPVYNDEKQCKEAEMILRTMIGDSVKPIHEVPIHGSDDFSRFQNELSGLFFFLGSADLERGIKACNHTPTFDLDERCLAFGVKTMSSFLFEMLASWKK